MCKEMQNEQEEDFFLKNCLSIINTFLPIITNNKENTFFFLNVDIIF